MSIYRLDSEKVPSPPGAYLLLHLHLRLREFSKATILKTLYA